MATKHSTPERAHPGQRRHDARLDVTHPPQPGKATFSHPSVSVQDKSDAYKQFRHRLTTRHKVCPRPEDKSFGELERLLGLIPGNTTQKLLDLRLALYYVALPLAMVGVGLPYVLYYSRSAKLRVPDNHFAMVEDRSTLVPCTRLYGPGYHFLGLYHYVEGIYSFGEGRQYNLYQSRLGDLTICVVEQGTIAVFEYKGQFQLLGPGLHMTRDRLRFESIIRLNKFYIRVGPEKWVTIPDQYDGIAIDNGKTVILKGGAQYHLPHENFQFLRLVPKTILTDRIVTDVSKYVQNLRAEGPLPMAKPGMLDTSCYLQTKTKDGAILFLDCMVIWHIVNTELAATKVMSPIEIGARPDRPTDDVSQHMRLAASNIDILRKTILRHARSIIAETVAHTRLTSGEIVESDNRPDAFEETTSTPRRSRQGTVDVDLTDTEPFLHFGVQSMINSQSESLVQALNRDIASYGVEAFKITINDAIPMPDLQNQLDSQAKARINRNTALVEAETQRQLADEHIRADRIRKVGEAQNALDAAHIAKQSTILEAEALAEREKIVAQGRREAATLQESSELGKQLALIAAVGGVTSGNPGDRVYVVGSPFEAMSRSFLNMDTLFKR